MTLRVSCLCFCLFIGCDATSHTYDAGPLDEADATVTTSDAEAAEPAPPSDFDGYVDYQLERGSLAGIALAIVRPDGITRLRTYGYANIGADIPINEHTLFTMASVSKTITAVRVMQQVEAGLLDLDEPIGTYLGYPITHPTYPSEPITLRRLLTHTSGLEDALLALAAATYSGDPEMDMDTFTQAYALPEGTLYEDEVWNRRPGTRHVYSNAAHGLIGAALEAISTNTFREQTDAAIFNPLEMDGAGWFLQDIDTSRLATPYTWSNQRYGELDHTAPAFYPATTLRVSVTGLARFARALMNGGSLDGQRILAEASVDEMLRVQVPDIDSDQALAFSESRVNGHTYIGHSGSTLGGATQFLLRRDLSYALILFSNSDAYIRRSFLDDADGSNAMRAILRRLSEEAEAS